MKLVVRYSLPENYKKVKEKMPKKKEAAEPVEIDFDEVMEAIRESDEIKMRNIFVEMSYEPGQTPEYLLHGNTCWEEQSLYYEYLEWLRKQGIRDENFFVGRDLSYGGYKKWR